MVVGFVNKKPKPLKTHTSSKSWGLYTETKPPKNNKETPVAIDTKMVTKL